MLRIISGTGLNYQRADQVCKQIVIGVIEFSRVEAMTVLEC